MLNIEYKENLDEKFYKIINDEFNKYATKNEVICNYKSFAFIAKDEEKFVDMPTWDRARPCQAGGTGHAKFLVFFGFGLAMSGTAVPV